MKDRGTVMRLRADAEAAASARRSAGAMTAFQIGLTVSGLIGIGVLLITSTTTPLAWLAMAFIWLASRCAEHSASLHRQAADVFTMRTSE